MIRRFACSLIVLVMLSASGPAPGGAGFWSGSGPDGGIVWDVRVEPGNNLRLYAVGAAGVYTSFDGGDTWRFANNGLPLSALVSQIEIDTVDPQRLYAFGRTGRVFRSIDRADSWAATGYVLPTDYFPRDMVSIPGIAGGLLLAAWADPALPGLRLFRSTDGGTSFAPVGTGLEGLNIRTLAVDPADANRVLAGIEQASTQIYLSVDGGTSFAPAFGTGSPASVFQFAFGPGGRVYASVNGIIHSSVDSGANWAATGGSEFGDAMFAHPVDADTLYVGTQQGLMRSIDGGATFQPLNAGLTSNPDYVSSIDASESTLRVMAVTATSDFPAAGSRLWVATDGGGVFRSTNAGSTWSERNNSLIATKIRALAIHPNPSLTGASALVYAGPADSFSGSPGMYRSVDGGATWVVSNEGLRASQVRAILVDGTTAGTSPGDVSSSHVYAVGSPISSVGFLNGGLYKSVNGGVTWSTIDSGLPLRDFGGEMAAFIGTVRNVVLDPFSCPSPPPSGPCDGLAPGGGGRPLQRVYATASGSPVSVAPFELDYEFRLIRSDNAGASWTDISGAPGFPVSRVHIVTSGTTEYRLFDQVTPIALQLGPNDPDIMFVSTFASLNCQKREVGEPFFATECDPGEHASHSDPFSGVFRSTDGGASWSFRSSGLPRIGGFANTSVLILSMVMHPSNPDILWASALDETFVGTVPSVFKTVDGGLNWMPSAVGIPTGVDIRALLVDPDDPNVLYASGAGTSANPGQVYKSEDGGATWGSISIGLPSGAALALLVDPVNAALLRAGTASGVWEIEQVPDGDGDGIPDQTENNAPDGGDGNGDGTPDALQGAVGSTVVLFNRGMQMRGVGGFATAEIDLDSQGDCVQLSDVAALFAPRFGRDFLPDGFRFYTYPRDLMQFELVDCSSAEVNLIYQNADFASQVGWSMRFYGPAEPGDDGSIGWYDFSARAALVAPNRWRLDLDAATFGSYRPEADRILFIGGPACDDYRFIENGFENDQPLQRPSCRD